MTIRYVPFFKDIIDLGKNVETIIVMDIDSSEYDFKLI
jgi:hypothetical protein